MWINDIIFLAVLYWPAMDCYMIF